jgi:hypothetical protein
MSSAIGVALATAIWALHFVGSGQARADVAYSTGFENPPFKVGPIAGQDGWVVFSGGGTPGAVTIEDAVSFAGSQAVEIDTSAAKGQTGPYHVDPSPAGDTIVTMQAEVMLTSSSVQSAWQFGGLTPSLAFFGGFNPLSNGTIQIITTGFPVTSSPVIPRDVWTQWDVVYDFKAQTFDILIDNNVVASNEPFLIPSSAFGAGIFDTFNIPGGNDRGYFDNYSITGSAATPEPATCVLFGTGCLLPLVLAKVKRRRRVGA